MAAMFSHKFMNRNEQIPALIEGCGGDQRSPVLTLKETAEYLGICKAHLSNVINRLPALRHSKIGRRTLIKREWADQWLEKQHSSSGSNGNIWVVPRVHAFLDAGKRQKHASKAFPKRQRAGLQAREASCLGCQMVAGRRPAIQGVGALFKNDEERCGTNTIRNPQADQQWRVARSETGVHLQRVRDGQYLPFDRKGWKESTAGTSQQIITTHLIPELGDRLLQMISRQELQKVLDGKARKLSFSAVAHIRWFLNAIFKLALSDGCIAKNPAAELIIPKNCWTGVSKNLDWPREIQGKLP